MLAADKSKISARKERVYKIALNRLLNESVVVTEFVLVEDLRGLKYSPAKAN